MHYILFYTKVFQFFHIRLDDEETNLRSQSVIRVISSYSNMRLCLEQMMESFTIVLSVL